MKQFIAILAVGIFSLTYSDLIVNGDFELGSVGFYTDYFDCGPLGYLHPDEVFTITTNPSINHGAAVSYGDHTSGHGNMMAINGSANPNAIVWGQDVDLVANTDYEFSIFISSWTASNLADLNFSLNGGAVFLGAITAPSIAGQWNEYTLSFNSGGLSGNTFLSFVDTDGSYGGNDFAVDDLSLVSVPEPSGISLLSFGLFSLLGIGYRRKKK